MPKKNVRYKPKKQSMDISFLPGSFTPGKSGHLITARPKGTGNRFIVLLIAFFLFVFTLMSVYAIYVNPGNPVCGGIN